MSNTYLDNEMEAWEKASDNDCAKLLSAEPMTDDEVLIDDPLVPIPEGEGTIKLHLKYGGKAMMNADAQELMIYITKLETAIRAAIKKLDGVEMPYRAREAIQILTEAVDED